MPIDPTLDLRTSFARNRNRSFRKLLLRAQYAELKAKWRAKLAAPAPTRPADWIERLSDGQYRALVIAARVGVVLVVAVVVAALPWGPA